MKTSRELLLERNEARSAQLDEIRARVIAQELEKDPTSVLNAILGWWTMNRVAWVSFASAWVVIVGLNLAANVEDDATNRVLARAEAVDVIEGVQRYQTRLAALLMADESVEVSEQARGNTTTRPRSDATRPRRNAQLQTRSYA